MVTNVSQTSAEAYLDSLQLPKREIQTPNETICEYEISWISDSQDVKRAGLLSLPKIIQIVLRLIYNHSSGSMQGYIQKKMGERGRRELEGAYAHFHSLHGIEARRDEDGHLTGFVLRIVKAGDVPFLVPSERYWENLSKCIFTERALKQDPDCVVQ